MPGFGRVTVPPPATALVTDSEDQISAFKLPALTEPAIVTDLGGWLAADAGGGVANQPGRFVLYEDDGSGLRPGAKICQSVQGLVTRSSPVVAVRLAVEGAPPTIQPGVEYWVAAHLGTNSGVGVIIIRGVIGGSRSVQETPSVYGPTAPNPYPVAGGASGTNSGGVGVVYSQTTKEVTGTICGTFLCGTALVGETSFKLNAGQLKLEPGRFKAYTASQIIITKLQKPQLVLRPKATAAGAGFGATFDAPQLILTGKATNGLFFAPLVFAKPQLILSGKLTALQVSCTIDPGKPQLILLAGFTDGHIPALSPTEPEDITLVPTTDETLLLVPTTNESLLLVPTVERSL